jgi:hypothetical protein
MIAYGILDISQYDTNCLAFKEVQPSNPQESKLVCVVLSLLLWNKAWRHSKAYNTNYIWMMGVQINGPSYIYGDHMSVIHNTQWPESTLKKKQVQLSVLPWGTWVSCYYGWIPNWPHFYSWKPCGYLYKDYTQWNEMRSLLVGLILYDLNDSHSCWCSPMMVMKGFGFPCQCLTKYQDTQWTIHMQPSILATKHYLPKLNPICCFAWGDWVKSHVCTYELTQTIFAKLQKLTIYFSHLFRLRHLMLRQHCLATDGSIIVL